MPTKKGKSTGALPLLFWDSTERSADLFYFGQFEAPDEFLAIEHDGKKWAVLSALEFSRGVKEGGFDEILSWEELRDSAKKSVSVPVGVDAIIAELSRQQGLSAYRVPSSFPLGLAEKLRGRGIGITVAPEPLFPERLRKNARELAALKEGSAASAAGLARAAEVLREAEIGKKTLLWQGKVLTSEILRREVDQAVANRGALARHTIVAGGDQACDPHCRGSGPLKPNELIIVDVFPRVESSGYHGDMTRTFLRGTPTKAQVKLVNTVREGQLRALRAIRTGVTGEKVHQQVEKYFKRMGYVTEKQRGVYRGFFHSTGHGLGLEVHEAPRLGPGGPPMESNMVVTVEPGLYYPGLGGVRIEDVVRVTPKGYEMLSHAPYDWIF